MSDIVERLRRAHCIKPCRTDTFTSPNLPQECACAAAQEAAIEIERLKALLREWEECAQYDALMSGPQFKGWNRSALDRCRKKAEARAALEEGK